MTSGLSESLKIQECSRVNRTIMLAIYLMKSRTVRRLPLQVRFTTADVDTDIPFRCMLTSDSEYTDNLSLSRSYPFE
jgi:hypothetical protein